MTPRASIAADTLRVFVYDTLIATGIAPSVADIAEQFGVAPDDARRALGETRIGKTLLLRPDTGEIWMAGPFATAPTPYRVIGSRVAWWANCAWDMLGIPVIVGESVDVEAACIDCGAPMRMRVDPSSGPARGAEGIVHFLVPARRWYEDIGFT